MKCVYILQKLALLSATKRPKPIASSFPGPHPLFALFAPLTPLGTIIFMSVHETLLPLKLYILATLTHTAY